MASLIEELIDVLEQEVGMHNQLIDIAEKKTAIIVAGDVPQLQTTTDTEQSVVGDVLNLERKRETIINDIATVINRSPEELNITKLLELLPANQETKDRLSKAQAELLEVLQKLKVLNERNMLLLSEASDMIEFTVNYIQSSKQRPETAGYTKATSYEAAAPTSTFDTKQ